VIIISQAKKKRKRERERQRRAAGAVGPEALGVGFQAQGVTGYVGGWFVAQYLLHVLHLPEHLERVRVEKRSSVFTVPLILVGLVFMLLLGVKRISHLDEDLAAERELAEAIGLPRWFKRDTVYRLLRVTNGWHVRQLQRVNQDLLREQGEVFRVPKKERVLDVDVQTKPTEGKCRERATTGYNRKRPGGNCLQWSVAACCGEIVAQVLRPGYVPCRSVFQQIYQAAKQVIGGSIAMVRLDGGYFDTGLLNFLLQEGLLFLIRGRKDLLVLQEILKEAQGKRGRWVRVNRSTWVLEGGWREVLSGVTKELRVIAVRQRQRKKRRRKGRMRWVEETVYFCIVTNLDERYTASAVYRLYAQRWTIENVFREINASFEGKLPCQRFQGNAAYLAVLALTYNISRWFCRDVLPRARRKQSWDRVRREFIAVPGVVERGQETKLNYPAGYRHAQAVVTMRGRLAALTQAG
jgi:hypothetical protein